MMFNNFCIPVVFILQSTIKQFIKPINKLTNLLINDIH